MSDKYWVGADMDWHKDSNWSLVSGGAGGAGIPTLDDDVFFDNHGYGLCWAFSPVECNNFFLLSTTTLMTIYSQGGIIHGDFSMAGGTFSPTGGGGYIIEFKGNWVSTGGQFSVGTGTGKDPTILFSGIGKTYQLNQTASATFQHLSVTGSLTVGGVRLGQMNISQKISVTGVLTINKVGTQVCDIDLSGNNAGFDVFTGEINGTGRMWYRYRSNSVMPVGGTIKIRYWRFYLVDTLTILNPRTYEIPCEVEIDYQSDGQVFRLSNSDRHYFYKITILCDEVGVSAAELDLATNNAEIYMDNKFDIYKSAFPNAVFTIKFGDGTQIFRGTVNFYFSYTSATTHLMIETGEGTIILWPKGRQLIPIPPPGKTKDIRQITPAIMFITYRLSRVYSAGQDYITYNKIILFGQNFKSASAKFMEGFGAFEFIIEAYGATYQFRKTIVPQMIHVFDRFKIIGSEISLPQIRSWLTITITPMELQINEESEVFSCKIRDINASYGKVVGAYNSLEYGINTNVEFYDRDVRGINRQRNILGDREKLTPTPAPEPVTEQILEKVL